jgi:hypothetical protein
MMRQEHNGMEKEVLQIILEQTGFVDGKDIRLLNSEMLSEFSMVDVQTIASTFLFPDLYLLVFYYRKDEGAWQTHDDKLQDTLRKRGYRVLSIRSQHNGKTEAVRIASEIVSEANLSAHTVPEGSPELFIWNKKDRFCRICGKTIGWYAHRHSGLCQADNLRERVRKKKEIEARVGA